MLKKIWIQAVNNLDSVLAILISIFAAFYSVFSEPLLAVIAGTLGLLAFGTIKDRNAREDLLKQVQNLKEPPNIDSIFLDRNRYLPFNELTASARKIYLVGPSLVNIFNQWSEYFQDTKLREQGATIQAIILNPQSPAVESAANCVNQSFDTIKNEIETTQLRVREILESKELWKYGKLELKTFSTYLNFSMVLIDPDLPSGKIFIELIGYRAGLHNIPHVELLPSRDKKWYEFYLRQYKQIYESSENCLTNS